MQSLKKKIFSDSDDELEYVNFGFSDTISACGISPSVFLYRNSINRNYSTATLLATDIDFNTLAPAGYYSDYDAGNDAVISRYWDGTAFVGSPEVCE